jgi:hypothetical protein
LFGKYHSVEVRFLIKLIVMLIIKGSGLNSYPLTFSFVYNLSVYLLNGLLNQLGIIHLEGKYMQYIKTVVSIVSISIFLFLSSTVQAKAVTGNDYEAVVQTAHNYFNGMAKGDQALLSTAFDFEFGDVKMITLDKDTGKEVIRTVPLEKFAGFFSKATQDTWKANVLSVDIVDEKMAMVKLNFDTPKTHYIDYLVMYKRQGAWKIINKTFVANKKNLEK